MTAVGIDIGGSGIRAARVRDGQIVGVPVRAGLSERGVGFVVGSVCDLVEQLGGADRVGVGMPGFVREGRVLASPNFPDWSNVDLAALISARLRTPVAVENDANAATIGAARRYGIDGDLVLLTLGTGVGGGVISEGRLLRGRAGTAAELGHTFVGGDRTCNCGGIGCLEQWCSTTGFLRSAHEAGHACDDGRTVVERAREGEPWAVAIVADGALKLGIALTSFVNIFAPDVIAIGGGLSQAEDLLGDVAIRVVRQRAIPANSDRLSIRWIGPADELAIVGSAMVARELP